MPEPPHHEVFLVWDIWAVIQTFALSFLIIVQTNKKSLVLLTILGVLSGGIAVLVFHDIPIRYLFGIWISMVVYSVSDWLLWRSQEINTFEFFALWHYVDVPTVAGLTLLIIYERVIGWLHDARHTPTESIFLSGAIAFQLIFGNVIIVLTKTGVTRSRRMMRALSVPFEFGTKS